MARIPLVDPNHATGELAETFEEIRSHAGKVGNVWRALANKPQVLKAVWDRRQAVMTGDTLPKVTKEAIALAVSDAHGCKYCVVAHSASLERLGESPDRVAQIRAGKGSDEAEQALLDFALQVTRDPHALTDDDFERLGDLGYAEEAIFEAVGVATHYLALNRFLDTFQIDLD